MRRIRYAGESVVTGDAIASLVVDYSEALAKVNTAGTVEIPVLLGDRSVGMATLLLGPASQLIMVPELTESADIVDEELVSTLRQRIEELGPTEAVLTERDDQPVQSLDDLDFPSDGSNPL